MKLLLPLTLPVALLLAFGVGVLFWALVSHIRFESYFKDALTRPSRLGFRGWLSFYGKTLVGAYILLWWSVRAAFQTALRNPDGSIQARPVLCIHGLFMNSTCMWGIRQRLERVGHPTRGVFMGAPLPSPLSYAKPLAKVMRGLAAQFPEEGFDIVAHSIGGVMVREVLRREPELAPSVHRIVTLGSPHQGTAVVRWIKFGPLYNMLALDSEYLQNLDTFQTLAPHSKVTTIGTLNDLVVYPEFVCHLEGSSRVTLDEISHLGLMTNPRALDEVERALAPRAGRLVSPADLG